MHSRLKRLSASTVLITALLVGTATTPAAAARAELGRGAEEAQEQPSASDGQLPSLETRVALTLEGNPGSERLGENTIMIKPGIMAALPPDGDVSTQGLAQQCPGGWLCAWPHVDFEGPMLAIQRGVFIEYRYWWWNTQSGQIIYTEHYPGWPGPLLAGWTSYWNQITSVYNNLRSLTWAPFHNYEYESEGNYYALDGAPAAYVGAHWNDTFDIACAC
jgi:hypothetical protein